MFTPAAAVETTNSAIRTLRFIIESWEITLLTPKQFIFFNDYNFEEYFPTLGKLCTCCDSISQHWETMKHAATAFPNIGKQ